MIAANLELADGSEIRFGPDEAAVGDIPIDTQSGTEADWGFAESSVVLKRPDDLTALDGHLFRKVTQYDEDGVTISEGRILGIPRVGVNEIEIDCEGPLAALDDNETIRQLYADRDLSQWHEPSRAQKITRLTESPVYAEQGGVREALTDAAGGLPGLHLGFSNITATASFRPNMEAWYGEQGLSISQLYYDLYRYGLGSASWDLLGYGADDDSSVGTNIVADLAGSDSAGYLDVDHEHFGWRLRYTSTFAGAGAWGVILRQLVAYGDHVLTRYGDDPGGFLSSDIAEHAFGLGAPGLPIAPNGIEVSGVVIPHLVFREDGTARRILDAASVFGASGFVPPDYGYYEDGCFWRSPGTYGREWHVRLSEGIEANNDGPSAEERCNGFKVTYTDGAGTSLSVGPPGSSSDYETTDLLDSDPTNPVNAAGIPARFRTASVGITSQAGAVLIGRLLMAEANDTTRTGSTTIKGPIHDAAGNQHMPRHMRFGDALVVEDDEGDTTAHRIRSTNRQGETAVVTVGPKPRRSAALLAQLAAAITPLGHF